jgi:hypothetical protein
MNTFVPFWFRRNVWLPSVLSAVLLGGLYRFIFVVDFNSNHSDSAALVMSIAFLAGVPFAMGYLSVYLSLRATPPENVRWTRWLFLPWVSVLIGLLACVALKWEGTICLLFAAPEMMITSLLGGVGARLFWGKFKRRAPGAASAFALPLLLLAVESHIPLPYQTRTVETQILIHAPASTVWKNIKSVRAIDSTELPDSWVNRAGFPKPVAATLSHEGVGGVRQAGFTGGLVFTETVNRWDEQQDLRFSIHANTDSIPPSTLDEHATIGGAFFDVLDGEYRLEPRADGILLHLTSRERLSTHFNPYAGLWTDAVMRAIQNQILVVVRSRCQAEAAATR